jgi:hypothetical protein
MTIERVKLCPNCGKANRIWQADCRFCLSDLADAQLSFMELSEIPSASFEADMQVSPAAPLRENKTGTSIPSNGLNETVIQRKPMATLRKVLKYSMYIIGASGVYVLWQRVEGGFIEAIDTRNWAYIIAWILIAILVSTVFWVASKL